MLALALPAALVGKIGHVAAAARRAGDAIRPARVYQRLLADVQVGEVPDGFLQCFGPFSVAMSRIYRTARISQVYYCQSLGLRTTRVLRPSPSDWQFVLRRQPVHPPRLVAFERGADLVQLEAAVGGSRGDAPAQRRRAGARTSAGTRARSRRSARSTARRVDAADHASRPAGSWRRRAPPPPVTTFFFTARASPPRLFMPIAAMPRRVQLGQHLAARSCGTTRRSS